MAIAKKDLTGLPLRSIALVELPTLPKGILSLSLSVVAAHLQREFDVQVFDLNFLELNKAIDVLRRFDLFGFKVSAQNYLIAQELTASLRQLVDSATIFWGGELPTLMPDLCLKDADSVVVGSFETKADIFISDLKKGDLKLKYDKDCDNVEPLPPAIEAFEKYNYYSFMGRPFESSKGCKYKCTFCLVHTMQKEIEKKDLLLLSQELKHHHGRFLNVIDYNLGMDRDRLISLCSEIKKSRVSGWMGEMCLESLDDDEVLHALQSSRCQIIYCGLETVSNESLKSINKKQNNVTEYLRIIRKAQRYGIEIACGFIIGIEGTTPDTFNETLKFYFEAGVIYVKFTFLTFNPGTKVHNSMKRKGIYLSEEIHKFDGHHLTFLPAGVDPDVIYNGTELMIEKLNCVLGIWNRSKHLRLRPLKRLQFFLFSYCFGQTYRDWISWGLLQSNQDVLQHRLRVPFKKTRTIRFCELSLELLRRLNFMSAF